MLHLSGALFDFFMLHESFQDPINVVVRFDDRRVMPHSFLWGKRQYGIQRVLNVHSTFVGRERLHYFSVANDTEFFRLAFNTETLRWFLVEHYQQS